MYCLLMIFSILALTPDKVEFKICYGVYIDDHYERKFTARERIWELKSGKLNYLIDLNDTRYHDSITLSAAEIETLYQTLKSANIKHNQAERMDEDYADKCGYSASIRGHIKIDQQVFELDFRTNAPNALEKNETSKFFINFEQLLYQLAEQ